MPFNDPTKSTKNVTNKGIVQVKTAAILVMSMLSCFSRALSVSAVGAVAGLSLLVYMCYYRNEGKPQGTSDDIGSRGKANSALSQHASSRLQQRSRFRSGQAITRVIACRSTVEYDKCIEKQISETDRVLVVQSIFDKSDNSLKGISSKARDFILFKGKDVWDVKSFTSAGDVDVVCINYTDAFGNYLLNDSVAMIRLIKSIFESSLRVIIIKDKGLARHANSYKTVDSFERERKREIARPGKAPMYQEPVVICAVGVTNYRSVIPSIIRKGDKVLEIGCARGTTIAMLSPFVGGHEDGGLCVGIDMGKVCVANSRKDHEALMEKSSNVRFETMNGWDISGLLKLSPHFNVIFVDVGGISGADGLLEGIAFIRQLMCVYNERGPELQLRYIVVKSRCLRDYALLFNGDSA